MLCHFIAYRHPGDPYDGEDDDNNDDDGNDDDGNYDDNDDNDDADADDNDDDDDDDAQLCHARDCLPCSLCSGVFYTEQLLHLHIKLHNN